MFEKLRAPWKKLIGPIAKGLVALGVTANMVTVAGAVGTTVFALLTGFTGWLFLGVVLMTIMVVFDSLDGSVAALTTGATAFGAFLDSSLDRIADWAVLLGAIIYLIRRSDFWTVWPQIGFWSSLVAMMTSFVTSYVRARAQSIGLDAKNGIATRSDRLVIILVGMGLTGLGLPVAVMALFLALLALLGLITVWQRLWTVYLQAREAGLTKHM
ncbi:CDP-diacylglycerol--glycerol-3-phosphate 3-phosphatidyltransferase [Parascardovia denticolens IPLA 20019]|uniref:phosphatidylinositol phosphate synthase n=1 Tax=Parascardovia denticolens TaxID=78258 RepID=UPI000266E3C4|nr:CDP-alcohol phosphatidyltransferase family protein [Parascardovia denticolens]EIT88211.1 CDP-diacylglycerol--glycerol-3-phosphate 3-phosphatidyltransferase [Parascardovia denticolens IPLA 20019]